MEEGHDLAPKARSETLRAFLYNRSIEKDQDRGSQVVSAPEDNLFRNVTPRLPLRLSKPSGVRMSVCQSAARICSPPVRRKAACYVDGTSRTYHAWHIPCLSRACRIDGCIVNCHWTPPHGCRNRGGTLRDVIYAELTTCSIAAPSNVVRIESMSCGRVIAAGLGMILGRIRTAICCLC